MRKREFVAIHPRWYGKLPPASYKDADEPQCGGCRFYMPIEGLLGADWGVCANPASVFDRTAVFEHHGCEEHEG